MTLGMQGVGGELGSDRQKQQPKARATLKPLFLRCAPALHGAWAGTANDLMPSPLCLGVRKQIGWDRSFRAKDSILVDSQCLGQRFQPVDDLTSIHRA